MKNLKNAILFSLRSTILALALFTLYCPIVKATTEHSPDRTSIFQEASSAVNNLADVQRAVVRVESFGSFWYRSAGSPSQRGSGSGFIINGQGLAVTNNHVVAGASALQIWVDGEVSPRSARILAVAECSDLAVIDIDGEGFPYLDWHQEAIVSQLAVHAAGFPYGTYSYTLTSGNISDTQAKGDSYWSSISNVIEHSAAISPGDSGGPLVDDQGKVVAINYLRSRQTGLSYAISQVEATPIIATLSGGQNVNSIGISGESVALTENAVAVWISAVTPDSPASRLGLQPGDIIWNIDGSFLDPNSLMIDYCNTLKRNPAGQAVQIEIYRSTSGQFLSGQINGQALRVINPPTEDDLTVPPAPVDNSAPVVPAPVVPAPATNPQPALGEYALTPPPTWSIVREESRNMQAGIEVEIELASGAGSSLLISAVGSEDVRFARIGTIHGNVHQSLLQQDIITSCTSIAESTLTYGAYEMTYSRWSSCTNSDQIATTGELYAMTAKSRAAPYYMVGLVGTFTPPDNGYDILLKTLAGLRVDNPPAPPPAPVASAAIASPQQPSPQQASPQQTSSATVIADVLNVRSGPGLQNGVISQVYRGNGLVVVGRFGNCEWLRVITPASVEGWVSGNGAYVRLAGQCATIPVYR